MDSKKELPKIAYVVCPDVCLDSLCKDCGEKATYSRLLLSRLLDEKERVCTEETKRFFGFVAHYHFCQFVEIILEFLNKSELTDEEIHLIQLILASLYRDGIEGYPYADRYTPILDLAEDKYLTHDVRIICNNESFANKLKEYMKNSNNHFKNHIILTAKEAYLNMPY